MRKRDANAAASAQRAALAARGADASAHPALHAYETVHLRIGVDWATFQQGLHRIVRRRGAGLIVFPQTATRFEIHVLVNRVRALVGMVYAGDDRFQPVVLQPVGLLNPVYERIGRPGRHYVQLPDNTYLRRFVIRGFNQADVWNYRMGQALQAPVQTDNAQASEIQSPVNPSRHNVMLGAALAVPQQILSHTRGWSKRFVSATTTSREVYSTRGEQFRSVFGAVLIDLAQVPLATVHDVHRPDRIVPLFNVTSAQIVNAVAPEPAYPRVIADESFLAARDVIRTREVLIKGSVPAAAIVCRSLGRLVLGIPAPSSAEAWFGYLVARDLGGRPIVNKEDPPYPWLGKWWIFLEFGSAADATHVQGILRARDVGALPFEKYDFPLVAPAGV